MMTRARWRKMLWAYNGVIIALAGTAALMLIVLSLGTLVWPGRQFDHEDTPVRVRPPVEATLETQFQGQSGEAEWMIAEVVSPQTGGISAYGDDVIRNLIVYDLSTGRGRRVFEDNSGVLRTYVLVDANCEEIERPPMARAESPPTAMVAMYARPGESTWRLGVALLPEGVWREVQAGVRTVDVLRHADESRCLVLVSGEGGERLLRFSLRDGAVESVPLVVQ